MKLTSFFCFPVSLVMYSSLQIILKSLWLVILSLLWTFALELQGFLVFLIWISFGQALACLLSQCVGLYSPSLFCLACFLLIWDFYADCHFLFVVKVSLSHYFCTLFVLFALRLINECVQNLWIRLRLLLLRHLCTLIWNELFCLLNLNGRLIHLALHLRHIHRCRLLF